MSPDLETAFAGALRAPGTPPPPGIVPSRRPGDRGSVERRFAVYRNTVVVGLVDALAARFPITERLLGEAFFRAMAREFALAHPPRSRLLFEYGEDLPDFLSAFPPARGVPFAAHVARLEDAISRAAHAADADAVGIEALADAGVPDGLTLSLHPSLAVVRSRFPIVTLHEKETTGADGPPLDMGAAEDALVMRPRLDVQVRRLPPGGAAFVRALARGLTLAEAAGAGASADGFDLPANLAGLFAAGAVTAIGGPA